MLLAWPGGEQIDHSSGATVSIVALQRSGTGQIRFFFEITADLPRFVQHITGNFSEMN